MPVQGKPPGTVTKKTVFVSSAGGAAPLQKPFKNAASKGLALPCTREIPGWCWGGDRAGLSLVLSGGGRGKIKKNNIISGVVGRVFQRLSLREAGE